MDALPGINAILEKCIGEMQAPCMATCPAHVNVPGFIKLIKNGSIREALELFREANPFPAICGRICHHPCEGVCTRGDLDEPVAIKFLHRFLGDWQYQSEQRQSTQLKDGMPSKIAVIGSGPAGLSCAYFLAKEGCRVVVFEKLPKAGGMLSVGIPEFRLPREVIREEIKMIEDMGVELRTGIEIGRDISIGELRKEGYEAFFLGVGAQDCIQLGIQGETLSGVYPGMDFLREVNLGRSFSFGPRIAVIGGGNVALDAARTARRLGANEAFIIYRRSLEEMPANEEEIDECREEGIRIETLIQPIRILGENGKARAIECLRMELGDADASGRRRSSPVEGSEFIIEVDGVILAVGQKSEWSCLDSECGCTITDRDTMNVNPLTLQTDDPDIFSGGDAVTGPNTVVQAIEAGKQAAISIVRYLKGMDLQEGRGRDDSYVKIEPWTSDVPVLRRTHMTRIPPDVRVGNFDEVAIGINAEDATGEAERCLNCECRICVKNCEFLSKHCTSPHELAEKFGADYFEKHPEVVYSCNLCGLCRQLCPNDLDIGELCLQLREQLVEEGLGPLRGHAFVKKNQDYAISDSFSLVLPDPGFDSCDRVFFPGCSLPGYSPSLAFKTYEHIRKRLPGTGIVLGCCGIQTLHLGERKHFEEVLGKTVDMFQSLGTKEVIVACPECYETLKEYAPELTLTFISDVLHEIGIPEGIEARRHVFSLHDPCTTRSEQALQESVRTLIAELGYELEEMEYSREKTRCCGLGGQAAFVDQKLAAIISKNRTEEAAHDLLTYCASCREALAANKPTVHVLDLIFNPGWEETMAKPPNTGKVRRENQARLKTMLLESTAIS